MIVRNYIECGTCSEKHTLRIQVGYSSYQEHTFSCSQCAENIVVGMHCDQSNGTVSLDLKENVRRGGGEGEIIYLSSEFPVHKDQMNQELTFPALSHMKMMFDMLRDKGVDITSDEAYSDLKKRADQTANDEDNWKFIKKGWSLTSKGNLALAEKQLQNYKAYDFDGPYELSPLLFDFAASLLQPKKYDLFAVAADALGNIKSAHPAEYARFVSFYKTSLQEEHLDRYFSIFSEYFKCHDDLRQTAMSIRANMQLPEDYVASSTNFPNTKLFYGNTFESLTSNLTVLACLNNIRLGRKFDEFANMDIKKYLTINKANRANPFSEFSEFSAITDCLDSTLRNASHHGSIRIDGAGRKITYRSGGTGAHKEMSYCEYLNKCNRIFISACALLKLEILIAF